MKVSNDAVNRAMRAYAEKLEASSQKQPHAHGEALRKDEAVISERARHILKAREALESIPDIRADKVEALKRAIETGRYNVTGRDVAEKLVFGKTRTSADGLQGPNA